MLPCISFIQRFRQDVSVHINSIRVIPHRESSILKSTKDIARITPCQRMHHGSLIQKEQSCSISVQRCWNLSLKAAGKQDPN